jgi:hypothetical protein
MTVVHILTWMACFMITRREALSTRVSSCTRGEALPYLLRRRAAALGFNVSSMSVTA